MKYLAPLVSGFVCGVTWLAGIVFAHGFWSTLAAICVPFYAWYLVIERAMRAWGVV